MAKINSKALDPQRYACIQAEQWELEQQYSTHITMARLCPYCKLRLETLCKGAHGATYLKCPQCGAFIETSIFELLTSNALQCPSCHLRLNIDRMKSKAAFDALRKVQNAQENLERKSKFNG